MAATLHLSLFLLLSSTLILSVTSDSDSTEREVVVQGIVYCQSCSRAGSWSLTGAKPLQDAKIGITCRDHKHRAMFYKSAETNEIGYFYSTLRGLDLKKGQMDSPINSCTAHLISSHNPKCNLLTNTNFGIIGAPLRYEDKIYENTSYVADLYSTGPFAFRPSHCRFHHQSHY